MKLETPWGTIVGTPTEIAAYVKAAEGGGGMAWPVHHRQDCQIVQASTGWWSIVPPTCTCANVNVTITTTAQPPEGYRAALERFK